ncbi:DolP-mannose mannosyltransferase [Natrinema salifodinae]|uniref:DolP-mannose mannosyltransferase n=1 Tax=Natrinema salifodinae TaxID=1202768 RepID=A0A1I0NCT4_9EURY|nr:DolP-mannose mannosyltransferase [Natrinema salifodinae]SEV98881.1 DolP-mannose mannosyltransferase [Natrinema salifodinae]
MPIRSPTEQCPGWLATLGPVVAVLYIGGFVGYLLTEWPMIATDAAFFQHTGWYILNGGVPYVDVWDVNPPVPYGVTAALAVLAGGNMLVLHGLSVTLTVVVAATSVLLVGRVAHLATGNDTAAVAAGLTMLVVPELFVLPLLGVRSQFYALFFGVLALALILRERPRPFLAGAAAALSAGSWQSGVAFALLVVGIAYQRTGRRAALSAIAGGGVVTGAVLVAFAAANALVPMVVQTVLAPLIAGSPYTLAERVYSILLVFGYGSVLLPVALYGWARVAVGDRRELRWVPAGGVILGCQVLFIDMDGSTDAFLWLVFVALGVALTVERANARWSVTAAIGGDDATRSNRSRWVIFSVIGLLVLFGLVWNAGSPSLKSTLTEMEQENERDEVPPITVTWNEADVPPMRTIYWGMMKPETCHYRLSWNELRWISMTDDRLDARECPGWPSRIDRG